MKKPMPYLLVCLLTLLVAVTVRPLPAPAQNSERVAAVVNDEVVTLYDLEQRMRVAFLSSGLPDNLETRSRVAPQVLRKLIDEHIELQELRRQKLSVADGEIENGMATIEKQNKMPKGAFSALLKSHDIDVDTMHQQIKAELGWVKVVRNVLSPNLIIGEQEIDARLAMLKANRGKPEYLGAELFLPVDSTKNDAEIQALAVHLLDLMRQGSPFSGLARQFSATGGSSGGDLGWVSEGMMDDELFEKLTLLHVGEVTPPIRQSDGYHILLLRQKRVAGENETTEPSVDIGAVIIPALPETTAEERTQQLASVRKATKNAKTCDDYESAMKTLPTMNWYRPGIIKLSQLPDDLRIVAQTLDTNQASDPIEKADATRILVMCGRSGTDNGLPSRDDIRRRIEDERMDLMAQRHLRDLRRAAFVEIRL